MSALLALALVPGAAQAGTLDQQQTENDGTQNIVGGAALDTGNIWGQTFTAGRSGSLDQVDLLLRHDEGFTNTVPLTVQITAVDADGRPTDVVLTSGTVAPSAVGSTAAWVTVVFAAPATVTAGTQYAIVASVSGGTYLWYSVGESDAYAAGKSWIDPPNSSWFDAYGDAAFKTYVAPPPPPQADLSLSMTGPATATSKSQVTYLVTVRNAGPNTATNVVLSDNLPYGTQFSTVTPSQGTCTPPGKTGKVACKLGDIASGGDSSSAVTLKVTARATSSSNINNVASVSSDVLDPSLADNSASFTTKVVK